MKAKRVAGIFGLSLGTALIAVFLYARFLHPEPQYVEVNSVPAARQVNMPSAVMRADAIDFTSAAENTVHAVVHVKTTQYREMRVNPLYEFFYGISPDELSQPVMGFGSGVIISHDGYIVTNNHVIEGSEDIEVTLNDRRTYKATLIGNDPTTDLAVLKIDEKDLPVIEYGNSDNLKLGEWVLAVGNPYNLTSTVTAGIVSAKARNIGILKDNFSLEAFIQTDAAVNPGNSGGALVDITGKLVGINTAIASKTGNYTGYSFAIPVSLVKKVVSDIMEFGEVQRALLGVTITDVTAELAEQEGLDVTEGVYVSELSDNGAAKDAGIKKGDVIISINDVNVNTGSELQEQVGRYRPNDKIEVVVKRKGSLKQFNVVLRNMNGNTEIVRANNVLDVLGATFEPLTNSEKKKLEIPAGVRVTSLESGKLMKLGVKKGFIVVTINNKEVNSVNDIADILRGHEGGVIIEGIYKDGARSTYAFGI